MKKNGLAFFIGSFFYAGLFPLAPGTFGSVVAFIIYVLFLRLLPPISYLSVCAFIFFAGVYFTGKAEKESGVKDPPSLVIDEVSGYFITMTGAFGAPSSVFYSIAGLVLFRVFDILKPFPIKYVDRRVPGGWGIMLDDAAAAVFSAVLLRIFIVIFIGL